MRKIRTVAVLNLEQTFLKQYELSTLQQTRFRLCIYTYYLRIVFRNVRWQNNNAPFDRFQGASSSRRAGRRACGGVRQGGAIYHGLAVSVVLNVLNEHRRQLSCHKCPHVSGRKIRRWSPFPVVVPQLSIYFFSCRYLSAIPGAMLGITVYYMKDNSAARTSWRTLSSFLRHSAVVADYEDSDHFKHVCLFSHH